MSPSFVVYAPSYDENSGGVIVLHLLCHYLRELGFNAALVPHFANEETNIFNYQHALLQVANNLSYLSNFTLMPNKNIVLFDEDVTLICERDDLIVIYPETTFGNPLGAKNVARWLLHNPGFFTGKIYFSVGEIQFLYSDSFEAIDAKYLEKADFLFKLIYLPRENYFERQSCKEERQGTAYCLRKSKGAPLRHDVNGSVLIDGLTHAEIGEIFRTVELFISYDSDTLYSWLAPLCGAKSVIVPSADHSESQIRLFRSYPGIAYGFNDVERAQETLPELFAYFDNIDEKNLATVLQFVEFWQNRLLNQEISEVNHPFRTTKDINYYLNKTSCKIAFADVDRYISHSEDMNQALASIQSSTYWQITKPLRLFIEWMKNTFR